MHKYLTIVFRHTANSLKKILEMVGVCWKVITKHTHVHTICERVRVVSGSTIKPIGFKDNDRHKLITLDYIERDPLPDDTIADFANWLVYDTSFHLP